MDVNHRIEAIQRELLNGGYVADRSLATALHLALSLQKPVLIEGPAGVGKTESAKALARFLGTKLIRLQCYEGLDAAQALYEWNYPKQMLRIQLGTKGDESLQQREAEIFSEPYLLRRPLLQSISEKTAPVLLIDEIDRADEGFEAFLLEVLAEFQVTIPELGTISAQHKPIVVLTSNRTRELSDALRRRCLYQWIAYPEPAKEQAILRARIPEITEQLADQIARFMQHVRGLPLQKAPGVAESLDWARALMLLGEDHLGGPNVPDTLGLVFKDRDDAVLFEPGQETLKKALSTGQNEAARSAH